MGPKSPSFHLTPNKAPLSFRGCTVGRPQVACHAMEHAYPELIASERNSPTAARETYPPCSRIGQLEGLHFIFYICIPFMVSPLVPVPFGSRRRGLCITLPSLLSAVVPEVPRRGPAKHRKHCAAKFGSLARRMGSESAHAAQYAAGADRLIDWRPSAPNTAGSVATARTWFASSDAIPPSWSSNVHQMASSCASVRIRSHVRRRDGAESVIGPWGGAHGEQQPGVLRVRKTGQVLQQPFVSCPFFFICIFL